MINTINLMMSIFLPFAAIMLTAITGSHRVYAADVYFQSGDQDFQTIEYKTVDRVEILEKFLKKYNSPLTASAETFVKVADKYDLDYRLLPSISCVESTCGKFLIQETHNPFGWGGGYIYFRSYDEAIERVGKGLSDIYLSRGLDTVEKIAPVYAPPSTTWASKVRYFMNQIDDTTRDM
jgi:hypothetical protein